MGNCLLFIMFEFDVAGGWQYILYTYTGGGLTEYTERINRWVNKQYEKHAILIEFHEYVAVWQCICMPVFVIYLNCTSSNFFIIWEMTVFTHMILELITVMLAFNFAELTGVNDKMMIIFGIIITLT